MPVSPSGLPGATIRPWSRCTSRTTAISAPSPRIRSRYGSVYSPVAGSSRCEPARWHSPSRSATRPPSDPTFDDARVISGSAARSAEAARSSTRSCEPIATIVRSISASPRSSSTWTCSPAWWPSTPAGTTSRPSARTSEVSTPAPRGSGVATMSPPTPPEPDPDPVVGADGRGQLAGQPGGGRRPLPRGRTLERGQHRRGEDVEGQRGRHRVAGGARATGWPVAGDGAQHDRVPGPHGDAVHGQRAGGRDHARGVVVAPGARPGDEDHQVGVDGGLPDRGGDQLGVVGDDAGGPGLAADLGGLRGQHHRVGVGDLAGGQLGADRADLVAGRDDHHPGPAAHHAARRRRPRRRRRRRPGAAGGPRAAAARWR